jgi:hypothetical protein
VCLERTNAWYSVQIGVCGTATGPDSPLPDCRWLGDPWIRHINISEEKVGGDFGVECGPGGLPCLGQVGSHDGAGSRHSAFVTFFSPKMGDSTIPIPET